MAQPVTECLPSTYKSPHFISNISKTLFDSKPKSKEETIQLRAGKKYLTKYFTKKRHTDKKYDRCYQVWWHITVIPGSQTACTKNKERKGGGGHHSGEKAQQLRKDVLSLPENLSLVPCQLSVTPDPGRSGTLFWPSQTPAFMYTYPYSNTLTHNYKIIKLNQKRGKEEKKGST